MSEPHLEINAGTQVYGIFGNPVRHSLSPLIHNELFRYFKINAVYTAFEVDPNLLGLAFEAVRSLGLGGVNVTVPFKEDALNFVDEVPEDIDRVVGAINTVVNRSGKLYGHNTDVRGFLRSLADDLGFNPRGKKALVLGAGGAARAVVFGLAQAEIESVAVMNRTAERAEGLCEYVEEHFQDVEMRSLKDASGLKGEKFDLVVNATGCGLKSADPSPVDLSAVEGAPHVLDLVYAPAKTALLKQAEKAGLQCANGLGMLAAQAALSFELWTGKKEGVRERMRETLKKCSS